MHDRFLSILAIIAFAGAGAASGASNGRPSAIEFGARSDGHGARLFAGLDPRNKPSTVAVAGDGAIWFRESFAWHPRIARIGTDGSLREFRDPIFDYSNGAFIEIGAFSTDRDGIRVGPVEHIEGESRIRHVGLDGQRTWVAAPGCYAAGTTFACFAGHRPDPVALDDVRPNSVLRGPRGDIWFTSAERSIVGRLAASGKRAMFTQGLSRWHSGPQFITTRSYRPRYAGRADHGVLGGHPERASLGGIIAGRDGNLWFTLYDGMVLGKITVTGHVTLYNDLVYPSDGHDFDPVAILVADRIGRLFYNEGQAGRIARVTLPIPANRRNSR